MSTLTKVLIVLQVVVALVLCGLVVTYVATADNYKRMYEEERSRASKANQQKEATQQDFEQFKAAKDQELAGLNQTTTKLNKDISELTNTKADLERDKKKLEERVNSQNASLEAITAKSIHQSELYDNVQKDLAALRDELTKKNGQLNEINDSIVEKMAIITAQTEQIRRLIEEKTDLQGKLEQLLRQYGKAVVPPAPTGPKQVVQPARPLARDIGLKGVITRIDMENSLAEISIGSADGVRQEMKFYVTRGDQFICNILVLEVEAQKAVGILDLVQQTPKAGDMVATNL